MLAVPILAQEITNFSYNPTTSKARVTAVTPTNELWRVQYTDSLTNSNWRSYANVLRGGTNTVEVYSPASQRYFRLKKE
jgi:hypothetical protein